MTGVLSPAGETSSTTPAAVPVTMAGALNAALADSLSADERVLVFGEDVGTLGGVFRVTDGLAARFGERRVFDTPVAESGIIGTAIGMAMNGLVPVVEMQFDAFAYPAGASRCRSWCGSRSAAASAASSTTATPRRPITPTPRGCAS